MTSPNRPPLWERLKNLDLEWIKSSIGYDETSPSCLRWLLPSRNCRIQAGDIAGCLHHSGYYVIGVRQLKPKIRHRTIYCHHIVLLLHDKWPTDGQECDHIDRDRGNNKITNLRWTTKAANAINRRDANKTGCRFVSVDKKCKTRPFKAQWWDSRQKKMIYVGMFATTEEAYAAAVSSRALLTAEADRAERGDCDKTSTSADQ